MNLKTYCVLAALALTLPNLNAAIVVTGPGALTEGNAEFGEPMSGNATFQYVVLGSDLTAIQGQTIWGLAFRSDEQYDPGVPAFGYQSLTISVGNTDLTSMSGASTDFATNSAGATTTYNSSFYYTNPLPSDGSPNDFGDFIYFTTPYVYTSGNLIVTVSHTTNVLESGGASQWPGTADAYSNAGGVLFSGSYNAESGTVTGVTPVTAFTTVPEPSTFAALGGLAALLLVASKRRCRVTA